MKRRRVVLVAVGAIAVVAAVGSGITIAVSSEQESLPPAVSTTTPSTSREAPAVTTPPATTKPRATTKPAVEPEQKLEANDDPNAEAKDAAKARPLYPSSWFDVIEPWHYGPLQLRMSKQKALATGLLGTVEVNDPFCTRYAGTFGGSVVVSKKYGVVDIRVTRPVSTSQGIHIGSTVADVRAAYPATALTEYRNGLYFVTEPGIMAFDVAGYHLHHTPWPGTGIVNRIDIDAQRSDCAGAF